MNLSTQGSATKRFDVTKRIKRGVSTRTVARGKEGGPPSSHYSPREPARASGGSDSAKSPPKKGEGAPPPLPKPSREFVPHPRHITRRVGSHARPAARPPSEKWSENVSVHFFNDAKREGGGERPTPSRHKGLAHPFSPLSRVGAPPPMPSRKKAWDPPSPHRLAHPKARTHACGGSILRRYGSVRSNKGRKRA